MTMRTVTLTDPAMLDEVIWRELKPAPKDQRRLYAQTLELNIHLLQFAAALPAGSVVNLPERPVTRPASEPVEMVRIFG
jgi:phage tail protein X